MLLTGCGDKSTPPPTSYTLYNSKEATFQCELPEQWETKGGGGRGPEWAKATNGKALIHIRASEVGSLLGDMAGGRHSDTQGLAPQLEPAHIVHVKMMEMAEQEYNEYTELPGSPVVLQCELGPARISEFTAKTSFGSDLHGYRATVLGHNKSVNAFCVCLESDWTALKPSFDRVFSTMQAGTRN